VSAFERDIARADWDSMEPRVVKNTLRLLDLLDRNDVKGTFFVLGWVGWRYPDLVREIDRRGHEVGCHGFWHRLIYQQTPEEFRRDLRMARDVLANVTESEIRSYRAPSFSITSRSRWALDILADEGFAVDSSVFPVVHDRYGIPGARRDLHSIETSRGTIWEFPPSTVRLCGWNVPVSGGGYFRLYPLAASLHLFDRIERLEQRPFMFYIHPWEIDADQPRLKAGTRIARYRHYVNLECTLGKLEALLQKFQFGRLCDLVPCQPPCRDCTTVPPLASSTFPSEEAPTPFICGQLGDAMVSTGANA
jgi:polysaccharide deacetylase family protein (PEP-CTERM system associated)